MNRADRRKAAKKKPAYLRETPEQIRKRLVQNGITEKDLKANYDKGYEAGFREAAEPVIRGTYAAIALALKELHGFGAKRAKDVLNRVDYLQTYSLTSQELVEQVYTDMKLQLNFKEPLGERIQEAGA